jgi:hypothetical protein
MHRRLTFSLLAAAALVAAAAPAVAQDFIAPHEELAFDRPEAWALNYFGSVSLLTGFGTPEARAPGSLEAAIELGWVPHLDAEQRRVGFGGFKEEDLNKAPLFVRPRLTVGLPDRFSLTVAYVPPVRVFGIESNVLALALARPLWSDGRRTLGGRLYAQVGTAEGAFTCTAADAAGGDDPVRNPFGCERASADEATLRYVGFELSASVRLERFGGLTPHFAAAVNRFDNRFQVNARTFGYRDRTLLLTSGTTWSLTAGVTRSLRDRMRLGVELFYSPLDVARPDEPRRTDPLFNARLLLAYRLR